MELMSYDKVVNDVMTSEYDGSLVLFINRVISENCIDRKTALSLILEAIVGEKRRQIKNKLAAHFINKRQDDLLALQINLELMIGSRKPTIRKDDEPAPKVVDVSNLADRNGSSTVSFKDMKAQIYSKKVTKKSRRKKAKVVKSLDKDKD